SSERRRGAPSPCPAGLELAVGLDLGPLVLARALDEQLARRELLRPLVVAADRDDAYRVVEVARPDTVVAHLEGLARFGLLDQEGQRLVAVRVGRGPLGQA